jgi:tripartite ATP-independent transporter DctM subunit
MDASFSLFDFGVMMEITDYLVIAMFMFFISLLITGFPVAYCLLGSVGAFATVGYFSDIYLATFTGLDFNFLGLTISRTYKNMSNWILVAMPMFIFMGLMLEKSGIAENLMKSTQALFGRTRGGLCVTVAVIGVLLAASTGIIGASVVLLGMLSLPAMLNQGYSKELAVGTIAGAGTLGILIPPSIMLVMMADQMALSVGDLFLGAVTPGLLLGAAYIIYILVIAYLKPDVAPLAADAQPITGRIIYDVAKDILLPFGLIVAVLGSIFAGVATVTEASGVGALAAVLLTLINGKLSFGVIREVAVSSFNTIGYIFFIFIGANCFALVLRGLGGDEAIVRLLTSLPLGPTGLVLFVLGCVFLLGFFLDWLEITLIILPLVAPIVGNLDLVVNGYGVVDNPKLVWFTILVAVTLQTSFLTPPVGFALFYLKGICPPEINISHLYREVMPYVALQLVILGVILAWPNLVTWLPGIAYK